MNDEQRARITASLNGQHDAASSPFSPVQGALPVDAPKIPDAAEREAWRQRTEGYATGANHNRFIKSDREKAVNSCCKDMDAVLQANLSPDMQVLQMTGVLRDQLQKTGLRMEPAVAGEQRQATVVLESLLAQQRRQGQTLTGSQMLTAISSLNPEQQRQLLQADRATGNRLYNQLEESTRPEQFAAPVPGHDPLLAKQLLEQIRPQINAAAALQRLDDRDTTGVESQLTKDFLKHLEQSGVSQQGMAAMCDKLAFHTQMSSKHGDGADLPKIDAKDAHGRDKFTARLVSNFASIPQVSDEDLSRAMQMPSDKLLMVTGQSLGRMNEGDLRLTNALKDVAQHAQGQHMADLHQVIEKTQARQWSRRQVANPAQATTIGEMRQSLEAEANQRHELKAAAIANRMTQVAEKMVIHQAHMQNTVLPNLEQRINTARQKIEQGDVEDLGKARENLATMERQLEKTTRFSADLQNSIQRVQNMNPTRERILPLLQKFGPLEMVDIPANPFPARGTGANPPEGFEGTGDETNIKPANFKGFISYSKVLAGHMEGVHNKASYAAGMANVAPVLPTAGRDLTQCPWLQSTVDDMVQSADFLKQGPGAQADFNLERTPLIIIDQSDVKNQGLWNRNQQYCDALMDLHQDSGLKIVHVSMADVERLAGADVNKLFDASQSRNAGYGGARNMAYMIAPVIRHCENTGQNWRDMQADQAREIMQQQALQRNGTSLFMGDDTDLITEGTILSKAVVANQLCGANSEYNYVTQMRDGRDTMGVNPAQTNAAAADLLIKEGYDAFASGVFGSNKWNSAAKPAGMGCTAGDARFCLDLPLGAEEKQNVAMRGMVDPFSGSSHLSGDRQGELSAFLRNHLNYANSSGMVKTLIMDSNACAWNNEANNYEVATASARFANLGEVMEWASQEENVKQSQQAFFAAMCGWEANDPNGMLSLDKTPAQAAALLPDGPLKAHLQNSTEPTANAAKVQFFLDNNRQISNDERAQLVKIKDTYNNAGEQVGQCRNYMNKLMDKLVPGPPPGSTLAGQAKLDAVQAAVANAPLNGPGSIAEMIQQTKHEMQNLAPPVAFDDTNRLMRDLHLATESVGGGGFGRLAQNIRGPAQNIQVNLEVGQGNAADLQQANIQANLGAGLGNAADLQAPNYPAPLPPGMEPPNYPAPLPPGQNELQPPNYPAPLPPGMEPPNYPAPLPPGQDNLQPAFLNEQAPELPAYLNEQAPELPAYLNEQAPELPAYLNEQAPELPAYLNEQAPELPAYLNEQAPDPVRTTLTEEQIDNAIAKYVKPKDLEGTDVREYKAMASDIHANLQPDRTKRMKPDTAAIEAQLIDRYEIMPLNEQIAAAEKALTELEQTEGISADDPRIEAQKAELNELYEDLDNWETRVDTLKASMKVDDRKNRLAGINAAHEADQAALANEPPAQPRVQMADDVKLHDGNPRQEYELQVSSAATARGLMNNVPSRGIDQETLKSRIGNAYGNAYTYEGPDRFKEDGSKQRVKGANDRGINDAEKTRLAAEMQPTIDKVNEIQQTINALEQNEMTMTADFRAEIVADINNAPEETRPAIKQAEEKLATAQARLDHVEDRLQALDKPGPLERAKATLQHGSVDKAREHYQKEKEAATQLRNTAKSELNQALDNAAVKSMRNTPEGQILAEQIRAEKNEQNKVLQKFADTKEAQAASIKPERVQAPEKNIVFQPGAPEAVVDVKSALKAGANHQPNQQTQEKQTQRKQRDERLNPSVQDALKEHAPHHAEGHGHEAGEGSLRAKWTPAAKKPEMTRSASAPNLGRSKPGG